MGTVFISDGACEQLLEDLRSEGHEIITVFPSGLAGESIDSHPDIYMCRVGRTMMIDDAVQTGPDIRRMHEEAMLARAEDLLSVPVIPSENADIPYEHIVLNMGSIGSEYPYDVPYNAAVTEHYFIHNTEFTAPALLDLARASRMELIHVKQGYTNCSCVIAGPDAVITADRGIAAAIDANNRMQDEEETDDPRLDCLLIEPGHVELPGFSSGFLGGASGTVDGKVYFNGDLSLHPDFEKICRFIEDHGYTPVWYEGVPLADIGSVMYLK